MKMLSVALPAFLGSLVAACSVRGTPDDQPQREVETTETPASNTPAPEQPPAEKPTGKTTKPAETKGPVETKGKKLPDEGADLPGLPELPELPQGGGDDSCCRDGEFFSCPSVAACLGGFDLNACMADCKDGACFAACADQLKDMGPPVGCTKAAPPPNVQCN